MIVRCWSASWLDDAAAGSEVRRAQSGRNRLEDGIAVGSIHQCAEAGTSGTGLPEIRRAEVRDGGLTVHRQRGEPTFELAAGIHRARDSGEDSEIGFLKQDNRQQWVFRPVRRIARVRTCRWSI